MFGLQCNPTARLLLNDIFPQLARGAHRYIYGLYQLWGNIVTLSLRDEAAFDFTTPADATGCRDFCPCRHLGGSINFIAADQAD